MGGKNHSAFGSRVSFPSRNPRSSYSASVPKRGSGGAALEKVRKNPNPSHHKGHNGHKGKVKSFFLYLFFLCVRCVLCGGGVLPHFFLTFWRAALRRVQAGPAPDFQSKDLWTLFFGKRESEPSGLLRRRYGVLPDGPSGIMHYAEGSKEDHSHAVSWRIS